MKNKDISLLKMSNLTESLSKKYRLNESYSTNGITLDKMKSDIQKAKNKLKKQKPRENFGQNEIRKIEDKYSPLQLDYYSDYSKLINDFIDWCGTVELNEDYGEDKYSLVGQDGNAFALMGYTARCMKECGLRDEIDEMRERATESDYDNLIMVCDEYVQRCNDIARDGFEEALNESISKRIHLTAQPGIPFELYIKRPGGPDPSMHGIDKFDEELEEPLDCGYINIGSILNNYKSEDDLIEHLGIAVEKKLKNSLTKLYKQKIRRVSFVTVEVSEVKDYLYINNVTYDEFIKNITKENFEESLNENWNDLSGADQTAVELAMNYIKQGGMAVKGAARQACADIADGNAEPEFEDEDFYQEEPNFNRVYNYLRQSDVTDKY